MFRTQYFSPLFHCPLFLASTSCQFPLVYDNISKLKSRYSNLCNYWFLYFCVFVFRYETRNTEHPNEVSSSQLIFVFDICWCNISTLRLPFSMLFCEQYFYIPLYRTSTKHYAHSTSSFFGVRQSFILLRHDVSETAKLCVSLSEEGSRTGLRKVVIFKFRRSVEVKKKRRFC